MEKEIIKPYKRRNYFIEKDFQAKFILKFVGLVLVGGLLTIAVLYYLALRSTTVTIVDSRVVVRTTADFLLPVLVQTVAIVTIIVGLATIFVTLFISHRIAGPLFRFKKVLQELEGGNFSLDFHIRNLDQLQGFADILKSMIESVKQRLDALKIKLGQLKEKLNAISGRDIPEQKQKEFEELKKINEEISKIINYFKT